MRIDGKRASTYNVEQITIMLKTGLTPNGNDVTKAMRVELIKSYLYRKYNRENIHII